MLAKQSPFCLVLLMKSCPPVQVFEVLHYIGSCVVKILKMRILQEKEEARRKKDAEHTFIKLDKKEKEETLALTPETPGEFSSLSLCPVQ